MENKGCFKIFKKFIECFDYDIDDFTLLESLGAEGLNYKNSDVYKVTPLLIEISFYAMIFFFSY